MRDGFVFGLGQMVADRVTGFKGRVTGRAEHLSGCNTYGVQPKLKADGEMIGTQWFDEPRLEHVRGTDALVLDERVARTGADSVPQPTRSSPTR